MAASWSVSAEPARNYLRMAITGFFTVGDVAAFADAVATNIARLPGAREGGHISLCDTRGVDIQSQDAVEAFSAMLANPRARSRRLAYVVDGALPKLQIRRLTARDDCRFFDTPAAAEAWLFDSEPAED